MMLAAWAAVRILDRHNDLYALQWLPVLFLAVGLALKGAPVREAEFYSPRLPAAVLMLVVPILYINYTYFHHRGWYFKGAATTGYAAAVEQTWADVNSGFALTSLEQIGATLAVDDRTLQETRRLIAERPGQNGGHLGTRPDGVAQGSLLFARRRSGGAGTQEDSQRIGAGDRDLEGRRSWSAGCRAALRCNCSPERASSGCSIRRAISSSWCSRISR